MEFAQYVVIPAKDRAIAAKLVEKERIFSGPKERFALVLTDKPKVIAKLPLALSFNNDEWAAWGFELTKLGKTVAAGLFGENAETGVDLEDNFLEGDIGALAAAFGVNRKKLDKLLAPDFPDVEKFANLLGFGVLPITPFDVDQILAERKTKTKTTTKPKTKTKRAAAPKKKPTKKPKKRTRRA
jgi:hypothetical protein